MDNKLLLVNGITLLYRESKLPHARENSSNLIRQIVSEIKLADFNSGLNEDKEILQGLKQTALQMCDNPPDYFYDKEDLLRRVRLNCADDSSLFEVIDSAVKRELDEADLKRSCIHINREILTHYKDEKLSQLMFKAANDLRFKRDQILDMRKYVAELNAQLEPYTIDTGARDPAIITEVDITDKLGMVELFKEVKNIEEGRGIMQTGWQGLNRLLDGGFRRGEEVLIGALQHNFKTGFTLSLFRHLALYNKPFMFDETKKPLLVRISFEDSAELNIQQTYIQLVENETGMACDINGKSEEEMQAYVEMRLGVNGYHVKFLRVDPTQWTYKHVTNKLLEYEAEGYEIHCCMLDYLGMIPTTGCVQGANGIDLRDLFRRLRNFTNPRKITLITPHQLSPDAKKLIRDGNSKDFVQKVANKGYYAGSTQLDQEVDLEIFIHIEIVNGVSYLTYQRGKHRKSRITPIEHHYGVLQFHKVGAIPDDLNKADSTRKRVGGGVIGSVDEVPAWDFLDV